MVLVAMALQQICPALLTGTAAAADRRRLARYHKEAVLPVYTAHCSLLLHLCGHARHMWTMCICCVSGAVLYKTYSSRHCVVFSTLPVLYLSSLVVSVSPTSSDASLIVSVGLTGQEQG